MSVPDFREALVNASHNALVARGPWRPDALAADIADAVLALLAERLGGDEAREVVATTISDSRVPAYVTAGRAARALAALRDRLGVTR